MDEKKNLLIKLGSILPGQPGLEDLLMLSSHRSGFKRENAVRRLGMLGNPVAIPYLIERANDWVPQVRAAARDALSRLLKADNASAFVAALPALMHLQTCGRDDHSGLLQAVHDFLLRDENLQHLEMNLQSPDARVARIVFRLLVERRQLSAAELVARGLMHTDVVVRSIVIDLLRELEAKSFAVAVERALCDPHMPVRREAFQQLLVRDAEAGLRIARRMLFDPSASVREIAVDRLLNAGEPVEQIYAGALTGEGHRVAIVTCVLWSWAYLSNRSRSGQVVQMLDAEFPAVRRTALQTIVRLLGEDARPYLEAALADRSPSVCKEAARLIIRSGHKPDAERLVTIARASGLRHAAVASCRVARHVNKWDWLKVILKLYGAADSAVTQETFSSEVDVWEAQFNRSSAQPDMRSLEEIVSALRASRAKLTESQVRLLEFTLRSYSAPL